LAVLAAEIVLGHSGTSSVKTVSKSDSYGGKKFKGDGTPRGGGTDPRNLFGPMKSNCGEICEK